MLSDDWYYNWSLIFYLPHLHKLLKKKNQIFSVQNLFLCCKVAVPGLQPRSGTAASGDCYFTAIPGGSMLLSHNCVDACAANFCTCTQMLPGSIFAINHKLLAFVRTCRNLPCLHRSTASFCQVLDTWKTPVTHAHMPEFVKWRHKRGTGEGNSFNGFVLFEGWYNSGYSEYVHCKHHNLSYAVMLVFSGDPTGFPTRLTLEFSAFDM